MTSAPASLAASRESLLDKTSRPSTPSVENVINKRYSADMTNLEYDIMSQGGVGTGANKPFGMYIWQYVITSNTLSCQIKQT